MSDGQLPDGTAYFGKLGQLTRDPEEDLVQCHLCGKWFRAVGGSHLTHTHGWTLTQYRIAFQLPTRAPTIARELSAHQRTRLAQRRAGGERLEPPTPPPRDQRIWVAPGRSLAALHPDFARQLHPTKNGALDPVRVASYSKQRLWWQCQVCGHEWQTTPQNRIGGKRGCPACAIARRASRISTAAERSLARLRPDLAAELLDEDPTRLGVGSGKHVRWRCTTCNFEWTTTPKKRTSGATQCPRCTTQRLGQARRAVPYQRSLAARHPDLAQDIHPLRNPPSLSDPTKIGLYTRHQIWWRCHHCGHEWQQTPRNVQRGTGCPNCSSAQADLRSNTRTTT